MSIALESPLVTKTEKKNKDSRINRMNHVCLMYNFKMLNIHWINVTFSFLYYYSSMPEYLQNFEQSALLFHIENENTFGSNWWLSREKEPVLANIKLQMGSLEPPTQCRVWEFPELCSLGNSMHDQCNSTQPSVHIQMCSRLQHWV